MTSVSELTAVSDEIETPSSVKLAGTKALGTLSPGAVGTLLKFDGDGHMNAAKRIDRLREMGFSEGLEVEFLHESFFGRDPIAVRVDNMTIAMRRHEANLIVIDLA